MRIPTDYKACPRKNETVLLSLRSEDGDAFCKSFGGLGVETPSEFQRITAQSFAAFTNHFLQFSQFVSECCVAAFLLQARKEKIEIVLTPQQFTQDLRVMSHLFQNRSVQWVQNS